MPDDLVLNIVVGALDGDARAKGYILDGFPRTLTQARAACATAPSEGIAVDAVVYLATSDDVARHRIADRAGAQGRVDDTNPTVIEHRLLVFHNETSPLLDFYRQQRLLPVPATDIQAIAHRIERNASPVGQLRSTDN